VAPQSGVAYLVVRFGVLRIRMQQSKGVSITHPVVDKLIATQGDWIPAIDGWRAIAVAAVVLHHINGTNPLLAGWAIGNLGVAVFFCISGFLAYYVLWRDEHTYGQISYSYFLQRRILRIWPAYFVVIAVAYLHAFSVGDPRADRLSGLLTFTVNIDMAAGRPWPVTATSPLWSIAIEEQFYILAPLMYLVLRSATRLRSVPWLFCSQTPHGFFISQRIVVRLAIEAFITSPTLTPTRS
jgi:peptidoglycan/LPS O-acetylase OafA/YrhL